MPLEGKNKDGDVSEDSNRQKDTAIQSKKADSAKLLTLEKEDIEETSKDSPNGENGSEESDKVLSGNKDEDEEDVKPEKGRSKRGKRKRDDKDSEEREETAKRPTRVSKRNQKSDDDDEDSEESSSKQAKPNSSSGFACERTNSDGKAANLKISAWNVAGLRAWIKKEGSLDYVLHQEQPDMMVLLETKCADNKLPPEVKIPDYQMYTVTSEKEGYCGVLLYSKIKPMSVQYGIGNKEFDHEGRCIIAEYKDFYLVCTYVPNAGQGLKTLSKKLKWDVEFLKLLKDLDKKKPVVLCGDLNVAHEPIDLANPKTNTKNAGYTKEERDDFSKLLKEGFVDSFRHLYPEKTGAYTFWSNRGGARSRNVGWRLDYFVLSERLVPNLCDSIIRSQIMGSDHCPITLCLHV